MAKVKKKPESSREEAGVIDRPCTIGYKIVFGTSGWRGKLGQDFIMANVQRATQGVAEYYNRHLKEGFILIGFDPRKGNREFAKEVASILAANSIPVRIILEEPTPTPVLAYLVNSSEEAAGVINLTASHNRFTDDGFKFSPHHGGAADKETTDRISKYANETAIFKKIHYESARAKGWIQEVSLKEAIDRYARNYLIPTLRHLKAWKTIVDYVKSHPDFKLVLDPMQGTAVKYLEAIYRLLEKEAGRTFVEIIHVNNVDHKFTHVNGAPNPTEPESIRELTRLVTRNSNTLGLATDGDGDRFGIIDFKGREISGNEIIALLAYFLAQKKLIGVIGKTVVTSNFVDAVAEHLGLELVETPVGFKWFVEKTVGEGKRFLIAGEESAHVGISPFMKSWDDGIAIGTMCLWIIASTRKSLISYKENVEKAIGKCFFYNRDNIVLTNELKNEANILIQQAKEEQIKNRSLEETSIAKSVKTINPTEKIKAIITLDGIKVIFNSGNWLCVRLSGTENVARLYTEVTELKKQESIRYIGKTLLGVSPERELSQLIQAAGKQTKDLIAKENNYRELGFEDGSARLGWVSPPTLQNVEERLSQFLDLETIKGKTNFVFSGMGGSINTIKALVQIVSNKGANRIYTIDSLDPAALKEVLSSVDNLSKTVVVGISKSGTTKETQDILNTFKEKFQAENIDYRSHFLWLTDVPQGEQKIRKAGWEDIEILPIQLDGGTDIGGRFTAPHTLIFLIPLLLLLNSDINEVKVLWNKYVKLIKELILKPVEKAYQLAKTDTQYFAVVAEEKLSQALETWITQLFQESLGSKISGFNPKTVVVAKSSPEGFEAIRFDRASSNILVEAMLNMYFSQIFVAIFAYYKNINFVTQPEVEIYKKKMKEISAGRIPKAGRVAAAEYVERIEKILQSHPKVKFLEVVCYWHLKDAERNTLRQTLEVAFPSKENIVFKGSDWNHHSYQAASRNEDTLFVILIKDSYENQISGIQKKTLEENINTLRTIAYATYETLKEKAGFIEVKGEI
ncbi:MAG: hypothetical protein QG670_1198 [Thermoproteota archaeon]|nr:hypothetical protein [Thermoproteota archaeon]